MNITTRMKKIRTGRVVSKPSPHTASVQINRMVSHPKYGKRFRVSKKFAVHDQGDISKLGDLVTIVETRPVSKTKSWKIERVVMPGETASELSDNNPELK